MVTACIYPRIEIQPFFIEYYTLISFVKTQGVYVHLQQENSLDTKINDAVKRFNFDAKQIQEKWIKPETQYDPTDPSFLSSGMQLKWYYTKEEIIREFQWDLDNIK